MDLLEKLEILGDAAKYDAACTSSGHDRAGKAGSVGSAVGCGICHSFTADGRCVSLLKVLMTNYCAYDCKYCQNRASNDVPRAIMTPAELADLTMGFYRRNYIEGLFLSSGVLKSPDYTSELMVRSLALLRGEHRFGGYIHAKVIPGTSPALIERLGTLADRISVNIELPSEQSLRLIAPQKHRDGITAPMRQIRDSIERGRHELAVYRGAAAFAPAGQATQMIIGATGDTDFQIMRLSSALYQTYRMKRVFYSAYIPVGDARSLPALGAPLLREHRLYQADWLLRQYGFAVDELFDERHHSLDIYLDPKCSWAVRHPEFFPVEINRADERALLRVPGIGVLGAKRILQARRYTRLGFSDLAKMRIVLKRAQYFITCGGRVMEGVSLAPESVYAALLARWRQQPDFVTPQGEQLSLLTPNGQPLLPADLSGWEALRGVTAVTSPAEIHAALEQARMPRALAPAARAALSPAAAR